MNSKSHRPRAAENRPGAPFAVDIMDLKAGQTVEMHNGFRWIYYRILYIDNDTILLEQPKAKIKVTIYTKHLAFYFFR